MARFEKIIDGIIQKTDREVIEWNRISSSELKNNQFLHEYIVDDCFGFNGLGSFSADYEGGKIFVIDDDGTTEILVQPGTEKALTSITINDTKKMGELKNRIINQVDNPEDFLKKLLD